MAYTIEGSDEQGYRVVDDERGPLTGRKPTAADALAAAGIKPEVAKRPGVKK